MGRERTHIHPDFRHEDLRYPLIHSRDRLHKLDILQKRADTILHLLGHLFNGLVQKIQMRENLSQQEAMMRKKPPLKSLSQNRQFLSQSSSGQLRQSFRAGAPREQGLQDRLSRDPHHIGSYRGKLDICRLQKFLQPIDFSGWLITQGLPIPCEISKIANGLWRDKASFEQRMSKQIRNPFTILDISLFPGTALI